MMHTWQQHMAVTHGSCCQVLYISHHPPPPHVRFTLHALNDIWGDAMLLTTTAILGLLRVIVVIVVHCIHPH